ncbi:NFACT family protein [Enterocloster lavalensis]|uniref:Rqc2 family fibronectin-binding protein n=1 Tax=Enterocloster lavalensis TaxID=460384 RepID=UPI002A80AD48|nr:NFACT RNA binding domain-containing protein [Enterocloster lavalensis]
MAFDGITVANLVKELKETVEGARISKIAQPEKDELLFTIKHPRGNVRLLLSASASLPLVYLTQTNKPGPLTAPNFCMLLRKHIGSARIVSVSQPGLERIIEFSLEHLDELGDLCRKRLIVEIMGKHSNIIFCKEDGTIIDSIKHVSAQVSSVREVLPGRSYFIPQTMAKEDPLTVEESVFKEVLTSAPMKVQKALYNHFTGISPIMAEEICYLASVDADLPAADLSEAALTHLYRTFTLTMEDVAEGNFSPNIVYEGDTPVEFSALPLTCYSDAGRFKAVPFSSISQVLEHYYKSRSDITRIRQKSSDLRRVVQTALERNYKKYDLQLKQLKDTEKREKYRIYGELLNTYGYELSGGEKEFRCLNYYTNEEITIPLDPQLSAKDNAKKHFDKYNKLKRTYEALVDLTKETRREIDHLESISAALDIALSENDLVQIKEELMEYGYVKKRRAGDKKPKITSKPFHYISSDGFHLYVGKNNYQNEELTFKVAGGGDWWFHAKGIPGSHVIAKTGGREDLPDRLFEEAGALAAFYSKGRDNEKVEIDYIQRKHIKKVAGAAPGFVIYHTNYSLVAEPRCNLPEAEG